MISSRAFYNGMTSDVTYYLQNAHGDVVNLTSETGDKTKTYRYDAFGVEKNSDELTGTYYIYDGKLMHLKRYRITSKPEYCGKGAAYITGYVAYTNFK